MVGGRFATRDGLSGAFGDDAACEHGDEERCANRFAGEIRAGPGMGGSARAHFDASRGATRVPRPCEDRLAVSRPISHEGGIFAAITEEVVGPIVDLSDLDLARHPPERLELARKVWCQRVRTEFRSIQIMTRFLTEVTGAGDPLEVYAGAADLVIDEIRHVRLCVALCEKLGTRPTFPDPIDLRDPEPYLKAPMAERALHTAIAMLCINETLSVAYVEDLRSRCTDPAVKRVLDATLEDEHRHQEFGWSYAEKALARFPASTMADWQHLVRKTLEPHRRFAEPIAARLDAEGRGLADLPEPDLAALGLFSAERQALLTRQAIQTRIAPRLLRLGLLAA